VNERQIAIKQITKHEEYRRVRGLTITDLAQAIGRSRPYVSRVECGHATPSAGYRADVAHALGVDEALIFGERAA
jgi:transcriptional regulator with XRE-family HTH domain